MIVLTLEQLLFLIKQVLRTYFKCSYYFYYNSTLPLINNHTASEIYNFAVRLRLRLDILYSNQIRFRSWLIYKYEFVLRHLLHIIPSGDHKFINAFCYLLFKYKILHC